MAHFPVIKASIRVPTALAACLVLIVGLGGNDFGNEAAGSRYGLSLPGCEISGDSGAAQRQRCLEALALYPAGA